MKLGAYPVAVKLLCCLEGGTPSSKRIEDDVSRIGRDQDGAFGDHRLQFVHAWPDLEFRVAIGRSVRPEIRQIHPCRIHLVAVAAVVPDFTAAMPAGLDRQAHSVEYARPASGVVEKRIMCRIELFPPRPGAFHGQRNPMPEAQPFSHDRSEPDCKLRCSVEKECSPRLQDAAALEYPPAAPGEIFGLCRRVVVAVLVVLADVERRIGKDGIDDPRFHATENLEAIGVVENSMGCNQIRLFHLTTSRYLVSVPSTDRTAPAPGDEPGRDGLPYTVSAV